MTRLLTEDRMAEIRANHRAADTNRTRWIGDDDAGAITAAFEDRADLLDEVDSLRAARLQAVEAIAEKRIASRHLRGLEDDYHAGRFSAFTECMRIIAPRVTVEDFDTAAELVKADRKEGE